MTTQASKWEELTDDEYFRQEQCVRNRLHQLVDTMTLDQYQLLACALKEAMSYYIQGLDIGTDPTWWKERFVSIQSLNDNLNISIYECRTKAKEAVLA